MQVRVPNMGKHFSLGAELLIQAMQERGWSQNDLAKALQAHGVKLLASSVINRWAHGLRRPTLPWALLLHKVLEIPPTSWNEPPTTGYRLRISEPEQSHTTLPNEVTPTGTTG